MPRPRRVALNLDLEWPYKRHAALFAGTQKYARLHGWESIIDEYVAENLPEHGSKEAPYDGVIARVTKKLDDRAQRAGVPLVNVWFSSPVKDERPGVFPDFEASGRMRAEHLLARGFRRFATVIREDRGRKLEASAFVAAVAEAGFPCAVAKIPLDATRTHATWQKTIQIIDAAMGLWETPIGISVNDEIVGRMIIQICGKRGWRVPQDVAIIAGWNEEILCEHPQPSLTSIELGFEQIGFEAARMLDKLMDQKEQPGDQADRDAVEHLLAPPLGMVVRESTDFYAVDDDIIAAALQFIAELSHTSIGADDVADAVGVEPRTLRRRFRKILGRPIVQEICRVRIERAKRELVQSDRSLDAIARDAGFGTGRQMREVFYREVGENPREYRKQRQRKTKR